MNVLCVDGACLEVRWVDGQAGAPVLVFLHEGLGSAGLWRDFPDLLARATGMAALVYSRLGYGASDPVTLPRPLDYMEQEGRGLGRLLDAAGIEQAILIGHSDGASIALIHAAIAQGRRVLGVAALAPHSFVEAKAQVSIAALREAYEQGDLKRRLARHHRGNVECAFRGWNDAWLDPAFAAWDIRPLLAAIAVPVLVIQGEDDEYGTMLQVQAVLDGVNGAAEALILPACRHAPHKDCPKETLAALARFVRTLALPIA